MGLLVGSLSASYRQPLLKALKALCKVCCRECYTLTQPQPFTLTPTPTLPLTLTLTLTFTLTKARGRKCYVFITALRYLIITPTGAWPQVLRLHHG